MRILTKKPIESVFGSIVARVDLIDKSDFKGKRILDFGCGLGWFVWYSKKLKIKKYIGVDIDENALEKARDYSGKSNDYEFMKIDSLKLPFKDNSFDTVVAWEVIEHIPRGTEDEFLSEICRVSSPKGALYLSTPHNSLVAKITDPAWWINGHRHYDYKYIAGIFLQNKLAIHKLFVRGGYYAVMYNLMMYINNWFLGGKLSDMKYLKDKSSKEYRKDGFMNIFIKATNEK